MHVVVVTVLTVEFVVAVAVLRLYTEARYLPCGALLKTLPEGSRVRGAGCSREHFKHKRASNNVGGCRAFDLFRHLDVEVVAG